MIQNKNYIEAARKVWNDLGIDRLTEFDYSYNSFKKVRGKIPEKDIDVCLKDLVCRVDSLSEQTRNRFVAAKDNREMARILLTTAHRKGDVMVSIEQLRGFVGYCEVKIRGYQELIAKADAELREHSRYIGYLDGYAAMMEINLLKAGVGKAKSADVKEKYKKALREIGSRYKLASQKVSSRKKNNT